MVYRLLILIGASVVLSSGEISVSTEKSTVREPGSNKSAVPKPFHVDVRNGIDSLAVTPDGGSIILTADSHLYVLDAKTGMVRLHFPPPGKKKDGDYIIEIGRENVQVDKDGQLFACRQTDLIEIRDVRTGEKKREIPCDSVLVGRVDGPLLVGTDRLNENVAWVFNWEGKRLATLNVKWLPEDSGGLDSPRVASSPDAKLLAVAGYFVGIDLWDVARGKKVKKLTGPDSFTSLRFSIDGRLVFASSKKGFVRAWDTNDGRLVHNWQAGPNRDEFCVSPDICVSPDGKLLAAGGWEARIHLFDLVNGKVTRVISTDKIIDRLAFMPDSKLLLGVSSEDGRIRRWEVASGRELPARLE